MLFFQQNNMQKQDRKQDRRAARRLLKTSENRRFQESPELPVHPGRPHDRRNASAVRMTETGNITDIQDITGNLSTGLKIPPLNAAEFGWGMCKIMFELTR